LHLLEHAASKASESTSEPSVKEVIVIVLEEASTKAASEALLLLIHLGLASPEEVIVSKEISEGVSSSEELSEDVFSMTR
jgi:hypothetical protein